MEIIVATRLWLMISAMIAATVSAAGPSIEPASKVLRRDGLCSVVGDYGVDGSEPCQPARSSSASRLMARAAAGDGTSARHFGNVRVIRIDWTLASAAPTSARRSGHGDHSPRNTMAPTSISPHEILAIRV